MPSPLSSTTSCLLLLTIISGVLAEGRSKRAKGLGSQGGSSQKARGSESNRAEDDESFPSDGGNLISYPDIPNDEAADRLPAEIQVKLEPSAYPSDTKQVVVPLDVGEAKTFRCASKFSKGNCMWQCHPLRCPNVRFYPPRPPAVGDVVSGGFFRDLVGSALNSVETKTACSTPITKPHTVGVECTNVQSCYGNILVDGGRRRDKNEGVIICKSDQGIACRFGDYSFTKLNSAKTTGTIKEGGIYFHQTFNVEIVADTPEWEVNKVFTQDVMSFKLDATNGGAKATYFNLAGVVTRDYLASRTTSGCPTKTINYIDIKKEQEEQITISCTGHDSCAGSWFFFSRCSPDVTITCSRNACDMMTILIVNGKGSYKLGKTHHKPQCPNAKNMEGPTITIKGLPIKEDDVPKDIKEGPTSAKDAYMKRTPTIFVYSLYEMKPGKIKNENADDLIVKSDFSGCNGLRDMS